MENSLLTQIKANLDESFFRQLAQHPLPPYYVQSWSRDCDMCESSRVDVYLSYISLAQAYSGYIEGLEWAEGPSSWELTDPQPEGHHTRDRVMENYENGGNGWMV